MAPKFIYSCIFNYKTGVYYLRLSHSFSIPACYCLNLVFDSCKLLKWLFLVFDWHAIQSISIPIYGNLLLCPVTHGCPWNILVVCRGNPAQSKKVENWGSSSLYYKTQLYWFFTIKKCMSFVSGFFFITGSFRPYIEFRVYFFLRLFCNYF